MNNITTELGNALVQGQNLNEVFRVHLELVMNELLQTEMSAFLNCERLESTTLALALKREATKF